MKKDDIEYIVVAIVLFAIMIGLLVEIGKCDFKVLPQYILYNLLQ